MRSARLLYMPPAIVAEACGVWRVACADSWLVASVGTQLMNTALIGHRAIPQWQFLTVMRLAFQNFNKIIKRNGFDTP
jgi:hypothetical protein